jgi:Na+(H+)/acetate symporter ActP
MFWSFFQISRSLIYRGVGRCHDCHYTQAVLNVLVFTGLFYYFCATSFYSFVGGMKAVVWECNSKKDDYLILSLVICIVFQLGFVKQ